MSILILYDRKNKEKSLKEEDLFHEGFMEESVSFVEAALATTYATVRMEAGFDLREKICKERPELVFNLVNGEGLPGGISFVPNLLEELGIPYTGSSGAAHRRSYDKAETLSTLKSLGILVPRFMKIEKLEDLAAFQLSYPVLVKPTGGGYSRGLHNENLVFSFRDLEIRVKEMLSMNYKPLLLTEYIEGREFTVGVLGGEPLLVLPPLEISFKNLPEDLYPFYSFEAKVTYEEYVENILPAPLSEKEILKLEVSARHIFRSLGLADYARLDFRMKEDRLYLLEVNSLPGLHRTHSDLVKMNEAAGRTYEKLILGIVTSARERFKGGVRDRLISGTGRNQET